MAEPYNPTSVTPPFDGESLKRGTLVHTILPPHSIGSQRTHSVGLTDHAQDLVQVWRVLWGWKRK